MLKGCSVVLEDSACDEYETTTLLEEATNGATVPNRGNVGPEPSCPNPNLPALT